MNIQLTTREMKTLLSSLQLLKAKAYGKNDNRSQEIRALYDRLSHKLYEVYCEEQKEKERKRKEQEEKWRLAAEQDAIDNKTLPQLGHKFIIDNKIIHGDNQWEVLEYTNNVFRIKVLDCEPHFSTYLDVGKEYDLVELPNRRYGYELWEIPGEQMKRSTSQMLIYFWDDQDDLSFVSIELDF